MKKKSLIEQVPLALFMGLLMGGATAFFFIQMPMVLIEQAVIASGLPTVIAAAGPPLGSTARALVAGSVALASGGFTWLVITLAGLIERPRRAKPVPEGEATLDLTDVHPETPLRRPIFAHADFGDPDVAPVSADYSAEEQVEQLAFAEWEEVIEAAPAEPMPLEEQPFELVDMLPPEPVSAPPRQPSIPELMARLEAGAQRRLARFASAVRPVPAPQQDFDGALRSALNELKQMAAR